MKNVILLSLLAALAICFSASAAERTAQIEPDDLVNFLNNSYESGKFTGNAYFTVHGIPKGPVTLAIDDAEGKRVFEHKYTCEVSSEEEPSCYITMKEGENIKPYEAKSGEHTFRVIYEGKELLSLKYKINVLKDGDWYDVWTNGDWEKIAEFDRSFDDKNVKLTIYGVSDKCGGSAPDIQVQLYREGTFVARGHSSPGDMYYGSCYTSFTLFGTDEQNFSRWLSYDDLKAKDGQYEIKYFIDKKLIKTYAFSVTGGEIKSAPPAGIAPALMPENLSFMKYSTFLYMK